MAPMASPRLWTRVPIWLRVSAIIAVILAGMIITSMALATTRIGGPGGHTPTGGKPHPSIGHTGAPSGHPTDGGHR